MEKYVLMTWPFSQDLFDQDWFDECILMNDLNHLDDIGSLIDALIAVYQISFNADYLHTAKAITDFAIQYFLDEEQQIFLFTSSQQTDIIIRKAEVYDSVVPSGNSQMAHVLYKLAIIFDNNTYKKLSETLLTQLQESIEKYPLSFGNWAMLMQAQHYGIKEIAQSGVVAIGRGGKSITERVFKAS